MNWRQVSLRRLARQSAGLGLACGLWASVAYEAVQGGLWTRWGPGLSLVPALLPGAVFGLVFGLTFTSIDEFLGHYPRRVLRAAGAGGTLGALGGLATLGPLALVVPVGGAPAVLPVGDAWAWQWGLLPAALGVLGAVVALASGLAIGRLRQGLRRAPWGGASGLLGGIVLAGALAYLPATPWVHLPAFGLWSAQLAVAVYWREKRFAAHWLRVLTGPGEDRILPLLGPEIRLGKLESNEIALPFYQEIHPVHCQMRWTGEHYQIVDDETGGMVMVNFRQVQEQVLKAGDLVKIGSALLQYGEAS